ncbi:Tail sheath protein Gp18 [Actinoplanes sp. SE50]|uniref:phage tail sheath family protein n=1 Tax=unclassified Actinoplanes TaxID=2626549 RepID=UPI00023EC778|nr:MULTISPECIES: phage tail sheath subtilisin-like domain-containing protein [unclassified Actinoplanes]AEV83119.1 Tail sheath protein Gp18 [Actinoplanes sp. SE50/110]ATO81514.1 Tail sheath protein Gp18 [Actinoplanes sp. SE50]SLL98921.1 Tail sheath protein Gp18 [Actinoplanes sp. SE50/110]
MAVGGAPGVYIEEQVSGSMPLQGVGTSVAAFVGFTERYDAAQGDDSDPEGIKPQLVTSWPQYERIYGGFAPGIMLPHAVHGFFANGGSACYVVRIPVRSVRPARRSLPATGREEADSLVIEAREPGAPVEVTVVHEPPAVEGEAPQEFSLTVDRAGGQTETYPRLTFGTGKGTSAAVRTINERSTLIRVEARTVAGLSPAERIPAAGTYLVEPAPSAATATTGDLAGSETERTGYHGLAIAEEVSIVAIPDLVTVVRRPDGGIDQTAYLEAQARLLDWCEQRRTTMAVLDLPPGLTAQQALEWRDRLKHDTAFGAAYYPHLIVANPNARPGSTAADRYLRIPPSGHVAGVWARTDGARGVWKAPANEALRGVARLETEVTTGEQDLLNPSQINCLRSFGANGMRVWGARTLASQDQAWRYINVRRLFIYVEETIRQGTQWCVFEPNDEALWGRAKRTIGAFLHQLWMRGALVGASPEQAFFVTCDETNNPPGSVDNGLLVVDVGLAPVKPAEYVIFRISQWQGGVATAE